MKLSILRRAAFAVFFAAALMLACWLAARVLDTL